MLALLLSALLMASGADEIRALLDQQVKDWNRGDIAAFLRGYDRSADLTFAGQSGVRRGFDAVEARYRENYPTAEKMGKLRFSEIEIRMLGENHALVLGRFDLERTASGGGPASGRFTLVLARRPAGWRILHDHTS
ncbi:MAG: SgcJ/EcaC family oxidoreductase [Bryobacteraceae bacterium]|nr:SgcJ/EcaC family oxidoreductase [Bryobacteraceae bacterium]